MRISDWSSDVCSSDLRCSGGQPCQTSAGQSATDPIPFIWKILQPSGRPPWLCPWSSIADRPLSSKPGELASFGGGAVHWNRCLSTLGVGNSVAADVSCQSGGDCSLARASWLPGNLGLD